MNPSDDSDPGAQDLSELRELLFAEELKKIAFLESQVARYPTTEAVARALPEAIRLSDDRSGRLKDALSSPVESALQRSVRENPQPLIDVIFPIIGPMIRKAVASAVDGLSQGLNQAAQYSLNPVFRWKAFRSGMPFHQYLMLETLIFSVEQVFLLHRETSLVLQHVHQEGEEAQDPDMVAGMLTALQQFAVDSFQMSEAESVDVFKIGDLQVHLLVGPNVALAAVVRGSLPEDVRVSLQELLESIEFRYADQLREFEGDDEPFEPLGEELRSHLVQEQEPPSSRPSAGALMIAGAILIVCVLTAGFYWLSDYTWKGYLDAVEKSPGTLVTRVEKSWTVGWRFLPIYRHYEVHGLRDPLSNDPADLLKDHRFLKPDVDFLWERFQSDHPFMLRQRVRSILVPPDTAKYDIDDQGVLTVKGRASATWIQRARLQATIVPGVLKYVDDELEDTDPLGRIISKLKPPRSVNLLLSGDDVLADGKASHKWILGAKEAIKNIPEATSIDTTSVVDLDLERFKALQALIEGRSVFFQSGTAKATGNVDQVLSATAADWKKAQREADTLGLKLTLEVTGQSDAVGTKAENEKLSLKRAQIIRDRLVPKGILAQKMDLKAIQSPNEDPRLRRVIFRVAGAP